MAQPIERCGGTIWRGRKVARVLTDGATVSGIVLQNGTTIEAPVVAIATGNPPRGAAG